LEGLHYATPEISVDPNDFPIADANGPYTGKTQETIKFSSKGTTDPDEIEGRITDCIDDSNRPCVDYDPWLAGPWTAAPVSPPTGLEYGK